MGELGSWILIIWGDIHPVILTDLLKDIGNKALAMVGLLRVCLSRSLIYTVVYKWRDKPGHFWKCDIKVTSMLTGLHKGLQFNFLSSFKKNNNLKMQNFTAFNNKDIVFWPDWDSGDSIFISSNKNMIHIF